MLCWFDCYLIWLILLDCLVLGVCFDVVVYGLLLYLVLVGQLDLRVGGLQWFVLICLVFSCLDLRLFLGGFGVLGLLL